MINPRQILVTNDDGIDSIGLHILARAMKPFGEVTIVAPDSEYSGAGAAIGAIWEQAPEIHECQVDGIETAWSVSGAPALCVMYARLGAFGFTPDLVVSGINPGANVGRSVYHSGTIGAAISARIGGIDGIAVSQAVGDYGAEGQGWGEIIAKLHFDTAAAVAEAAVEALVSPAVSEQRTEARVLNINVPDLPMEEIEGWEWTEVGTEPSRALTTITLEPKPGHVGSYTVDLTFGDAKDQAPGTDVETVAKNRVSLTWLSSLTALSQADGAATQSIGEAVNTLLT